MPKSKADQPTFDFTQLSWADARMQAEIQSRILQATVYQQLASAPDATPDQLMKAAAAANDMLDAMDSQMEFMARVVTFVPADWFVAAAPADLNFADSATYAYLRQDKAKDLIAAMNEAQAAPGKA